GKVMSIPDEVMANYYLLLLGETLDPAMHPMEAKKTLAGRLVARFHSQEAARAAREDFETRFSARKLEDAELPKFLPPEDAGDFLSVAGAAFQTCFGVSKSRSELRRLMEQGSVQWNGEKVTDVKAEFPRGAGGVLRLDKKHAVRVEKSQD